MEVDLRAMRIPYKEDDQVLLEENLPTLNPILLFKNWFEDAKKCKTVAEPNAVCVSTCDKSGNPSSRMLLLKGYGDDGFKIFTNLESRKGIELQENPKAALLFYWGELNRQIRIEGTVELLPDMEAKEYFESRPKKSQIGAAISNQSKPIDSRKTLIERYNELEVKYSNDTFLPKPNFWGGFKIKPRVFEFWQGQSSRIHDRIVFRLASDVDVIDNKLIKQAENGWTMERLQP